ncbi:MAG: hypothetical protein Sapg2KO_41690 [Saprospiraceae bacterium]
MQKLILVSLLLVFGGPFQVNAQPQDIKQLQELIQQYKNDPRGPYKDIRWFCKDGSLVAPKERCPQPGGVQRARYKDAVVDLGETNHIYLGQILSKTPVEDFWDTRQYNSRIKQYQLEKYLRAIDEGWVLQKGQYYRGAFQTEDEENWGIDFFNWLLEKDQVLEKQFFLVRQAVKDIPHQGADSKTESIRALSMSIADAYPAFMNLRVKIHGQPEASDIDKVVAFQKQYQSKMPLKTVQQIEQLLKDMRSVYLEVNLDQLTKFSKQIPSQQPIAEALSNYQRQFKEETQTITRAMATAELLFDIRQEITNIEVPKARLALLDISNFLEGLYFQDLSRWEQTNLNDIIDKICYTSMAAAGTGLVENWEWVALQNALARPKVDTMDLGQLYLYLESARSVVEWGTNTFNGVYKDVVNLYGTFEPKAYGFYDDRIRSSVLLPLGDAVGDLGVEVAKASKLSNKVLDVKNQSNFRGLNPGYAFGELVVVNTFDEEMDIDKNKIYVFQQPPADLKPVAGILTVTEGNMVSHVQLLARNLGIPNAVLSLDNMESLQKYHGERVFLAVSNQGTVLMKTQSQMSSEEENLFTVKARSEERITVPVEKIDLSQTKVLDMRAVNAASSGTICGPKAANLGQLKQMFPDNVVEGLVLPFGVFKQHLDQKMPNQEQSYWQVLNAIFTQAKSMEQDGSAESTIESYVLGQLASFREAIKNIQLLPSFEQDLVNNFEQVLGQKLGEVPVFIRSDTNMEDLKDFTGAGLNLTLFNIVDRDKIIQGIKDVWASPYTERSFKWRQRYLLNPENVFPSILIIPSVNVDYSGVMITKGVSSGTEQDLTIAFSRGAGGAVDGQAAETYLIDHRGIDILLAPAREPLYRQLPISGGSKMESTTFEKAILSSDNRTALRQLAQAVRTEIPKATNAENTGPYDIELGFKDNKIWLFQIRPFVENKKALSSGYLERIAPKIDYTQKIQLNQAL